MKRYILLTICLLAAFTGAITASAQDDLAVGRLFETYNHRANVTEIVAKGKAVKPYRLTLFRSLTAADDPAIAKIMEQAVKADAAHSSDKEIGTQDGQIYYAFISMRKSDGSFAYIFYRNNLLRDDRKPETTIVYMEGEATLDELKRMFSPQ